MTPSRSSRPSPRVPQLFRDVAPGIHRLAHAHVNCYLVVDGPDVTLVDAAFPTTWRVLPRALAAIGRRAEDVQALVLTHAHFDHLGFARRVQEEWGVPVLAHAEDAYLAAHPYRYAHETPRTVYPIWYPASIPVIGRMVAAGALAVSGIEGTVPISAGETLDVPGSGPQVVSGAATADLALAFASLDALAEHDAEVILPGHGEPWWDGMASAVSAARRAGPS